MPVKYVLKVFTVVLEPGGRGKVEGGTCPPLTSEGRQAFVSTTIHHMSVFVTTSQRITQAYLTYWHNSNLAVRLTWAGLNIKHSGSSTFNNLTLLCDGFHAHCDVHRKCLSDWKPGSLWSTI